MTTIFIPGCALMLYKPALAKKIHRFLCSHLGEMPFVDVCCLNSPPLEENVRVINICPGCDKRYRATPKITTISLWEVLAELPSLQWPDYKGVDMSIHDACPTRKQDSIHQSIRYLLQKMKINLVEPHYTREKSVCCGDSSWNTIPLEDVKAKMHQRASQMPRENVVVYCVSCIKSMSIGGKIPRYLPDLLFGESTSPGVVHTAQWHQSLETYRNK